MQEWLAEYARSVVREVSAEPNDVPRDENGMAYEFHEILTMRKHERERSPLRTG